MRDFLHPSAGFSVGLLQPAKHFLAKILLNISRLNIESPKFLTNISLVVGMGLLLDESDDSVCDGSVSKPSIIDVRIDVIYN
jgi:hypothetical protein